MAANNGSAQCAAERVVAVVNGVVARAELQQAVQGADLDGGQLREVQVDEHGMEVWQMRHVILTCKNHPDLRWYCEEIAYTEGYGYNGSTNIVYNGHKDRTHFPAECTCSARDLVLIPEHHDHRPQQPAVEAGENLAPMRSWTYTYYDEDEGYWFLDSFAHSGPPPLFETEQEAWEAARKFSEKHPAFKRVRVKEYE